MGSPSLLSFADFNIHGSNAFDCCDDAVARFYGADSLRGSGHDDVSRIQRVKGGGKLDELGDAENHVFSVRVLPLFAVYRNFQIEISWIGNFVSGYKPGAENRIAVRRLAKTAFLRPANRNVEADGVPCDVLQRIVAGNVIRALPDDHRQLHFVIVAPLQFPESDALGRPNKRAARLEEQPDLVDYGHMRLVVVVQLSVAANFIEVLLIVDRSTDDLARVRDRT